MERLKGLTVVMHMLAGLGLLFILQLFGVCRTGAVAIYGDPIAYEMNAQFPQDAVAAPSRGKRK